MGLRIIHGNPGIIILAFPFIQDEHTGRYLIIIIVIAARGEAYPHKQRTQYC